MPRLKFFSEIISRHLKIFLSRPQQRLAKEISRQLKKRDDIEVVEETDHPDIIVHIVGFDPVTLDESLQHTSLLHKYLDLALKDKSKFVLVVPVTPSAFRQVAVSLVEQFKKNFSLRCKVVEVDTLSSTPDAAIQVLRSVIADYHFAETPPAPRSQPVPHTFSKKRLIASLSLVVMAWYLLWGVQVAVMFGLLNCSITVLTSGNFPQGIACPMWLKRVATTVEYHTQLAPGASWAAYQLGYPVVKTVAISRRVGETAVSLVRVGGAALPQLRSLLEPTGAPPPGETAELVASLRTVSETLALLEAEIDQLAAVTTRPPFQLGALRTWAAEGREFLLDATVVVPDLPGVLSVNRKSVWLVLLQDNAEIRPTGGYIDAVALVTVDNGRLGETQLLDVAALDSQLRGQVDPPYYLKLATGEPRWYLRDANWDPDFPTTARRAAWFVSKELGRDVDLVVAVNLSVLRQLLSVTGPVSAPGFSGQISEKNFWEIYLTQVKEGVDSPRYTLGVSQAILEKLPQLPSQKWLRAMAVLLQSLQARQTLIFPLNFVSRGLTAAGWDGQLTPPECRSSLPCIIDTNYLVDSNVGINKADASLRRQVTLQRTVTGETLEAVTRVLYRHTGVGSAWPSGDYKGFARLYLPSNAQIVTVSLNRRHLDSPAFYLFSEHSFVVVGVPLTVAAGQEVELEVIYRLAIPPGERIHYQLDTPNQPGLTEVEATLRLAYPPGWSIIADRQPAVATSTQVGYNFSLNRPYRWDFDLLPAR